MTYKKVIDGLIFVILIHMPHTWHDRCEGLRVVWAVHFNPHATYVA